MRCDRKKSGPCDPPFLMFDYWSDYWPGAGVAVESGVVVVVGAVTFGGWTSRVAGVLSGGATVLVVTFGGVTLAGAAGTTWMTCVVSVVVV